MSSPQTLTYYEILNLTPSIIKDAPDASKLINKAYRRALLQNHPDKSSTKSTTSSQGTTHREGILSIDQVTTAFKALSSPRLRREYDAQLRQAQALSGGGADGARKFQTGVENVDLDDLPCDETQGRWYRSCRCGNERGYVFGEEDLIEAEEEGELMVGCQDCSLWLRVHFAVVEDEAALDEDRNKKDTS